MSEVEKAPVEEKNGHSEEKVAATTKSDTPVVDSGKTGKNAVSVSKSEKLTGDVEVSTKKAKSENEGSGDAPTKNERAIIRQVEYYFGDANLRRDKFLLEQISNDKEGWVPLSVLLTFKRLAALTTDPQVVVDAIMKSEEGLLEVSDDKQKLRRHPERPIPEQNDEVRQEMMSRTVYAKGFPLDSQFSDILDFFTTQFENAVHITMRKYADRNTKDYKFKGSVFVTFAKKEQATAFLEKDKVVYEGRELSRKWQDIYLEEKKEELKSRRKKHTHNKKAELEEKLKLPKGAVVFFENGGDNVSREMLRDAVANVGDWHIAYIDYSKGEKDGYIRFQEEGLAEKFLDSLKENKLKLQNELEVTLRSLNEEEEKNYLAKALEQIKSRRNYHNKNKSSHGNRKRRGLDNGNAGDKKKKLDA